jgi:hypothetical protein
VALATTHESPASAVVVTFETSISGSGVGRARSEQKSRARFVDRIVFYSVVDPAGRRPGSGALVVYMNTGLGLAAKDGV